MKSISLNLICLFTRVGLVKRAKSGKKWVPSSTIRKELGIDLRDEVMRYV